MIVNGVNLPDPDVGDLEFLEKYEEQNDIIAKKSAEIDKNARRSEAVRIQCTLIFEFFDAVFGEGTARKIFGEKVNLKTCIDAYEETVKGVNALDAQLAGYFRNKHAGNRQQRRDQQNSKHKQHKKHK